jgi:hypothetical protein
VPLNEQSGLHPAAGRRASEAFKSKRSLLVGGDGVSLDAFLSKPVERWAKP